MNSNEDFRLSPRKSGRTPKKRRLSASPPRSHAKRSAQPAPFSQPVESGRSNEPDDSQLPCQILDNEERASPDGEIVLPVRARDFLSAPLKTEATAEEEVVVDVTSSESAPVLDAEGFEHVYSSLPPDISIEQIVRVTRSNVGGERLRVSRTESGALKIVSLTALEAMSDSDTNFHIACEANCVVCSRVIVPGEMFLNFPDDLDRRRIWGSLLGFKYQELLRAGSSGHDYSRARARMVTIGSLCTDHFAEECFRMYNFNKAAIEALGVPKNLSPNKSPVKRRPWSCTACSFTSYSVYETQQHILEKHLYMVQAGLEIPEGGFSCPFCRKCTYGYKTVSGFKRHMQAEPLHHCHLRRIHEVAREMCRAAQLEPVADWRSWTDEKVSMAYYGFVPSHVQRRSAAATAKRKATSRPVTAHSSPAKVALLEQSVAEEVDEKGEKRAGKDSKHEEKEGAAAQEVVHEGVVDEADEMDESVTVNLSEILDEVVAANDDIMDELAEAEERRKLAEMSDEKGAVKSGALEESGKDSGSAASSSATTVIRVREAGGGGPTTTGGGGGGVPSPSTRARALAAHTEPLDPIHFQRFFTAPIEMRATRRQLEAAEARKRLFGDSLCEDEFMSRFPDNEDQSLGREFMRRVKNDRPAIRRVPLIGSSTRLLPANKNKVAILRTKSSTS